jgi:hypothetical protein
MRGREKSKSSPPDPRTPLATLEGAKAASAAARALTEFYSPGALVEAVDRLMQLTEWLLAREAAREGAPSANYGKAQL